jgi:hypothetical protein
MMLTHSKTVYKKSSFNTLYRFKSLELGVNRLI